jgi:group I intron endonuclease
MVSGIYSITSPSGGRYIGSAVNIGARWRQHRYEIRKSIHFNKGVQRAATKYGVDNLVFSILIICRVEDLIVYEQRAIDILKPRYNACPTAGSQLGRRHSPEAIRKSSESRRGKSYHTLETRAAVQTRMLGNKYGLGVVKSTETKAKISAGGKNKRPAWAFLSRLTDERRDLIVKSYESGAGIVMLAKGNRVDHRIIKRVLLEAGVTLRKNGGKKHSKSRAPIVAEPVRIEIAEKYRSGESLRVLSKNYGMNREAIKRAIFASGLEARSRSQAATLRYQ